MAQATVQAVPKTGGQQPQASQGQQNQKKDNLFNKITGFIMKCMMPLIPGLVGTSMIKVLLIIGTTFFGMDTSSSTYIILYSLADCFFFFFPIFLAYTGAQLVGGNPALYMAVGAALVYPNMLELMSGATLPLGTFLGLPCTYIFGIPVITAIYTSSVIPMIMMMPIMKIIEDFCDKVSPNAIKAFFKPLLFCLIALPILILFIGPIGTILGNALGAGISFLYEKSGWLTVGILAGIMPYASMTGMGFALIPVCITSLSTLGYDPLVIVAMFASNVAQGGACLAVATKTKDTNLRSLAIASGISASALGVITPAMYEVNLPLKKPLQGVMVGGALAGLFAGLFGLKVYTMGGAACLLTLLQFLGGTSPTRNVIIGAITATISFVGSFFATLFLYKDKGQSFTKQVEKEVDKAVA